jgi:hypothetical protein
VQFSVLVLPPAPDQREGGQVGGEKRKEKIRVIRVICGCSFLVALCEENV